MLASQSEIGFELWESLLNNPLLGFPLPLDFSLEIFERLFVEVPLDIFTFLESGSLVEKELVVLLKNFHRVLQSGHLVTEYRGLRTAKLDKVRVIKLSEVLLVLHLQGYLHSNLILKQLLVFEQFGVGLASCLGSTFNCEWVSGSCSYSW